MAEPYKEDLFEGTTMTFGEHLEELRTVLFRSLVALVIGFLVGLLVAKYVVRWIQSPLKASLDEHYEKLAESELSRLYGGDVPEKITEYMKSERLLFETVLIEREELRRLADAVEHKREDIGPDGEEGASEDRGSEDRGSEEGASEEGGSGKKPEADRALPPPLPTSDMVETRIWRRASAKVSALSAQEAFMIWLKAAFVSGLLLSSPYIFFEIWSFVAAGLYPHEKKYVYLFLPISLSLFWSGAALAFFFVFQFVLRFLFSFNRALDIHTDPRISEWMGFVLMLPLGFGIAFQLPLVMFFLNRIGIFTIEAYLDKWRIAVLVIFVISMMLTPADPVSMLLMAVPLTFLYFLGVGMSKWMPRSRSPFGEAYEP